MEKVKCLIIGSGPAGYTAAIYTSRANLNPVLYEGIEPGGQLTTTTEIDNYPGYPEGIDGNQLMGHMRKQAERFGADIRRGTVTRADLSSRPFHLVVDGEKQIEADSLIIATGASARYLGLPSETKYRGQGVSACATCDGFFYRKKDVAVVGGGDTACEEATYLASICRQVYMIVRKPYLRASKAMQHRVMNTPNIEVLFEYNTAEVLGDDTGVTGVTIRHNDGKERTLAVAGFFVANCSATSWNSMPRGISTPKAIRRKPPSKGSSRPATCRIPPTGRPSPPPVRAASPRSTASASCCNRPDALQTTEASA